MANIFGTNGSDPALTGTSDPDVISGWDPLGDATTDIGDDLLSGLAGADQLFGGGGNDLLDGGTENDIMVGGTGNDTYVVDNGADVVTELASEGTDTVQSSITYTLGNNVENLTLTGSGGINGTGNLLDNTVSGNSGGNILNGAAGDDLLSAGLGADSVVGGSGTDTLVVDYSASTTSVTLSAPTDTGPVIAGFPAPGGTSFSGVGSPGNAGGRTGTYSGFVSGEYDTLWWGPAAVSAAMDGSITPATGEIMTLASISGSVATWTGQTSVLGMNYSGPVFTRYVATIVSGASDWQLASGLGISGGPDAVAEIDVVGGTFVVKQEFFASSTIDGTYIAFNDFFNSVQNLAGSAQTSVNGQFVFDDAGTSGTISDGAGGNSTAFSDIEHYQIQGGTVDDVITTANGNDTIAGNAGNDALDGSGGTDTLQGGDGDDTLYGGTGDDTLDGGDGSDAADYATRSESVSVSLNGSSSVTATIGGGIEQDLLANVENINGGSGNDNLTGDGFNNALAGGDGDDTLKGGGGDDTLTGGNGNDSLKGAGGADSLDGGAGIDTLSYDFGNAVTVDLSTNTVSGLDATGEVIANFENVLGSGADDSITGDASDNDLNGSGGNDIIIGGDGADVLTGGDGNDTITDTSFDGAANTVTGGAGNDLLINQYTDIGGTWDGGDDNDTIDFSADTFDDVNGGGTMDLSAASFTLFLTTFQNFENVIGSQGNNVIVGTAAANTLDGQGGNDNISGDAGNDTIDGGGGNDVVNGGNGADTIDGGDGNDVLNGGGGIDSMAGGAGDDNYAVDSALETIIEAVGGGLDTVFTGVTFTLGAGQEIERLQTNNQAGTLGLGLFGNEFANTLTANAGNNTLNGGSGADIMRGLGGNDTYTVDNAGDVVTEGVGNGTDQVLTSITYILAGGQEIETLKTTNDAGVSNINLTGNEFSNSMTGNAGNNILSGGLGADTMRGLSGNDSFVVDNAGDVVIEAVGGGTDTVFASVSHALQSGQEIENLQTNNAAAVTAINLTGNNLNNTITGNAGNNTINGGLGIDIMIGLGGNDIYVVDNTGDIVNESVGNGTDTVLASASYTLLAGREIETLQTNNAGATDALVLIGNEFTQAITGNAGNNTLNGKLGNDTLNGGNGQDSFVFDTTLGPTNIDTITSFIAVDDTIVLENAIFTALTTLGTLTTGAFNTGVAATQADDRIIYNSATKGLLYDADGVGGVAAVQFATLSNVGGVLSASDFTII